MGDVTHYAGDQCPGGHYEETDVSEFKCYQAAETTNVVLGSADLSDHKAAPDAVVVISRAVGSPKARALMRLCRDVLNGDMLAAQHELDLLGDDDE